MKILRALLVLVLVAALVVVLVLVATGPEPLASGSESRARLAEGPWDVVRSEYVWVDPARPTAANGEHPGAPDRTFHVAVWSPDDAKGPHPLVVYSHGFMSNRHGGGYLAQHLASHGYVVVATDYPLTHFSAPGGPHAGDVVNQPGDVSFLIDRMLSLPARERDFAGGIDRDAIAVVGLSLGGLTSTLTAFHPRLADPRIRAAVSIAGPATMFGPDYFDFAEVPFLMIAGTHDAMIVYDEHAASIPEKITEGGLVTIEGASHAGFADLAGGAMRLLGNPDALGCRSLSGNLDVEGNASPFSELGGPAEGMLDASDMTLPCSVEFEDAMHPGRQHMFTKLAVRAFLESHFADDADARQAHRRFLTATLAAENDEVGWAPAIRAAGAADERTG